MKGAKTDFKLVLTPKKLHMLGRFLAKIGLGIIAFGNAPRARDQRFDRIRRYARYGEFQGLWPLFLYSEGSLKDLTNPMVGGPTGETVFDEVSLYSYGLVEVAGAYTLFRFSMGGDNWVVCLDDPYPMPIIRTAFPARDLKLIWYDPEQLRSSPRSI